jgi:hypothetical protein
MQIGMPRALLASLLLLVLLPASAAAQSLDYEGPDAQVRLGERLTFAVRSDAPAVTIRVAGSPATGPDGLLEERNSADHVAAVSEPGLHVWTAPASFLPHLRPGRYWWQAYADGAIGAVEELVVDAPAARRGRGALAPGFGRRGRGSFYLSNAGWPEAVGGDRFAELAGTAASRWGLRRQRWTTVRAGRRDGFNVVGFGRVPGGALGVQTDYLVRSVRNGRVVGSRVLEQDIVLDREAPWFQGPGYPDLAEIDLETVLIHELGHMAGNKGHERRCANSPFIGALGPGEWWRGARDRWVFGCSGRASAARARGLLHRTVVVTRAL